MSPALTGYLAVVGLAVAVIGAATMVAVRRPPARSGGGAVTAPAAGIWFGVLAAVLLAARGSLLMAALVLLGVAVYAGIVRARRVRGGSPPGSGGS